MSPRALGVKTQTAEMIEVPTLVTLAERCGELHRTIETGAEALANRYVEMFILLAQAKQDAGPRGWLKWLAENEEVLGFGERQARRHLKPAALPAAYGSAR